MKIQDIRNQLIDLYRSNIFRVVNNKKTVELQNAHFEADEEYILRQVNLDYANREIKWYKSMSLNVNDIPGGIPKIWKDIADNNGKINSNYGWCIFSEENGSQFNNVVNTLVNDPHSRQAVMIYNRPSMYTDWNKNGMYDFMCTFCVQCFLNDNDDGYDLKYIVYQRSCDAVFGFNNDHYWHKYVQNKLASVFENRLNKKINCENIYFNIGSLHVYERHFKYFL